MKMAFKDYEKRVDELRKACLEEEDQQPLSEESLSVFKEFLEFFPSLAKGALYADYEGNLRISWADWGFSKALSKGKHKRIGAPVGEGSTIGISFIPENRMLRLVVLLDDGKGGKGLVEAFNLTLDDVKTIISLLTEDYETLIERRERD